MMKKRTDELEWQLPAKEYFNRLGVERRDFREMLSLPDLRRVTRIIPLRGMKKIHSLIPIKMQMLTHLLNRIITLDGRKPFGLTGTLDIENVEMATLNPHLLKIGQKFVYRENYQKLLEEVPGIFKEDFCTDGGLGNMAPHFVFGEDVGGKYSVACYLPPIVEQHGADKVIMDGIHRNFIAKQAGSTVNAIIIYDIALPFPCSARSWNEIEVISLNDKPKDINQRYFDLHKGLFRDLKHLGIDG